LRYYYLDASALVKVYAEEAGSSRVRDMVRSATVDPPTARCVVSVITQVEASSAVAKKEKMGEITTAVATRLLERIRLDFTDPLVPTSSCRSTSGL
jgi:predicted nucleic acid-binding protein